MYIHKVASNNSVGKVTPSSPSSVEGLSLKKKTPKDCLRHFFLTELGCRFGVEEPEKM